MLTDERVQSKKKKLDSTSKGGGDQLTKELNMNE